MDNVRVIDAITWGKEQLAPTSSSAKLDSEVILLHVLKKPKSYLFSWPEAVIEKEIKIHYEALIARRAHGEPVAHIIKEREFWSLLLEVNSSTLIPRPDTETLVEYALNLDISENAKVLDLGTGSGAIALALASERPSWNIMACDFSKEAVKLATRNQIKHNLSNVTIKQSDWFDNITEDSFDLIVSNPPYIDANDEHLCQGDVRFEPLSALVAGDAGMADIEVIIAQSKRHLCKGGLLLIEHGYNQANAVQACFTDNGYKKVQTIKDLGGCERVTLAQWTSSNLRY